MGLEGPLFSGHEPKARLTFATATREDGKTSHELESSLLLSSCHKLVRIAIMGLLLLFNLRLIWSVIS